MPLQVFTARLGVRDPDVLDVSRKSGGPEGLPFAPSWDLLNTVLEARWHQRQLFVSRRRESHEALEGEARLIEQLAWEAYVPAYLAEMRRSYRRERAAWDAILERERVVLVCYCKAPERCHRTLLGRNILAKLGAGFHGELPKPVRGGSRPRSA